VVVVLLQCRFRFWHVAHYIYTILSKLVVSQIDREVHHDLLEYTSTQRIVFEVRDFHIKKLSIRRLHCLREQLFWFTLALLPLTQTTKTQLLHPSLCVRIDAIQDISHRRFELIRK
jgi:hypothetical protein